MAIKAFVADITGVSVQARRGIQRDTSAGPNLYDRPSLTLSPAYSIVAVIPEFLRFSGRDIDGPVDFSPLDHREMNPTRRMVHTVSQQMLAARSQVIFDLFGVRFPNEGLDIATTLLYGFYDLSTIKVHTNSDELKYGKLGEDGQSIVDSTREELLEASDGTAFVINYAGIAKPRLLQSINAFSGNLARFTVEAVGINWESIKLDDRGRPTCTMNLEPTGIN